MVDIVKWEIIMKKRNKKRKSKKKWLTRLLIGILIFSLIGVFGFSHYTKIENEKKIKLEQKELSEEISTHYGIYVRTNKETILYDAKENEIGKIGKNIEITLQEQEIDYNTKYFVTTDFEQSYYIKYQDVEKIETLSSTNDRYKKYILFNENIITKEQTAFYDENDNLVYELNKSFDLPIIIKFNDKYGIEFKNKLLYIYSEDVLEIKENNNTKEKNSTGIPVLNYHFVYEDGNNKCNEEICHSESQINQHFSYIKDNNFFTPTMKELEMYIDGNLKLPQKSIVITFDDGTLAENAKRYVDMYELNATLFLITSWFDKEQFESEYLEIHSHGHDIHNGGVCPGGQGGAIKCLEKDKLLEDLETSRNELDGSTVFCYPFYEYNNYSIEALKEAGFTMAFAGEYAGGNFKVKVGSNKFRLPRWVIVNWTTMEKFKSYVNGGE